MQVTAEQRRYARIAGIMFLAHFIIEALGDYPTIVARSGETFAQTARYVVKHEALWRAALLCVALREILSSHRGLRLGRVRGSNSTAQGTIQYPATSVSGPWRGTRRRSGPAAGAIRTA